LKSLTPILVIFIFTLSGHSQVINLEGQWKFHIDDKSFWALPDFDDSKWGDIHAPSAWEEEGFNNYDGFAWYRKKFDGRKLDKNEVYYLGLGFIDDSDEVYVNGKLIGFSGKMPPKFKTSYNTERKYALPPEVINYNGDNLIAIRVFDVVHGGGIIEGDLGIFVGDQTNHLLVDLQGIWSFTTTRSSEVIPKDATWENLMVPGGWDRQGYGRYDGYAWYKKTFSVSSVINPNEPLMVLVGKIDDFDKVYLNGKLIGSTNDHRQLGLSHSYTKPRAYEIQADQLKKTGNVIEVLVLDIGDYGGIYEGTVGIATRKNYDRYFRD